MSHSFGNSNLKRKRPESALPPSADRDVLNVIKAKKDSGIWIRDIKNETKLTDPVLKKTLKSLMDKNLIKEVANMNFKAKKHYMAVEFEPSKEISGGDWYVDGNLDKPLIDTLKKLCLRYVRREKVATVEAFHKEILKTEVVKFEIKEEQIEDILNLMVLDNDIIEVKSTGFGDYYGIPIDKVCYRVASKTGAGKVSSQLGAFASIPCGACPRISLCTPDGVISPTTCVYYTKWLNDIDF